MSFAGVSVIANGELLGDGAKYNWSTPSASGYHLLVVQGHARTRDGYIRSHAFTVGGHRWRILYHRVRDSGSDRYSDYDSDSDSGSCKIWYKRSYSSREPRRVYLYGANNALPWRTRETRENSNMVRYKR